MKNFTVYLDNCATTFPKPELVYRTVFNSMKYHGGNPSRAGHRLSMSASRDMYNFRESMARMYSMSNPENVIATFNATHGLNIAIRSVLSTGDHVIISDIEHNSVFRTVSAILPQDHIHYFHASGNAEDCCGELIAKCKSVKPKAVICLHASNVCSLKNPIEKIGRFCRDNNIIFIVDGAQSAGHIKLNFDLSGIDAFALSGHKGLLGPMGTGALLVSKSFAKLLENAPPLLTGGSGGNSSSIEMPALLPDRFEAGTMPSPLFAGLGASADFISKIGFDAIAEKEKQLYNGFRDVLLSHKNVKLYLPDGEEGNVLSFNITGNTPTEVADLLDKRGICIRSGYHCAPLAHRTLGTYQMGGTARISFGIFNTRWDVEYFHKALKEII